MFKLFSLKPKSTERQVRKEHLLKHITTCLRESVKPGSTGPTFNAVWAYCKNRQITPLNEFLDALQQLAEDGMIGTGPNYFYLLP